MKIITKDNYKDLETYWEGIVVAYPKIDLFFNAEFYIYKQEVEGDNFKYYCCGYNKTGDHCDSFSSYWPKDDFESCFNCWDRLDYYQFEDLKEFCEWYLHKDDKIKQIAKELKEKTNKFYEKDWIQEKCGTNTPPTSVPEKPSKGNKFFTKDEIRNKINPGWNTRRQRLQEVIDYIDHRERISIMAKELRKGLIRREDFNEQVAILEDWLNEEIL